MSAFYLTYNSRKYAVSFVVFNFVQRMSSIHDIRHVGKQSLSPCVFSWNIGPLLKGTLFRSDEFIGRETQLPSTTRGRHSCDFCPATTVHYVWLDWARCSNRDWHCRWISNPAEIATTVPAITALFSCVFLAEWDQSKYWFCARGWVWNSSQFIRGWCEINKEGEMGGKRRVKNIVVSSAFSVKCWNMT